MEVIDHQPHIWFLFKEGNSLFLDANCNCGAFGYSYMIELSAYEIEKYENQGPEYIGKLANDIHHSAPVVKGSNSIYIGRDVSKRYFEQSMAAIKLWKERNNSA